MITLIYSNFIHTIRSKMFIWMVVFSFLIQVIGLKIMGKMTLSVQGMVSVIGNREAVFISLFFQLFIGFFISAIYGIWMAPYPHQGQRSMLTYMLPISKWSFPLSYLVTFLFLMLIQYGIQIFALGYVFGGEIFKTENILWGRVFIILSLELLAFLTCMMGFSFSSLTFGQITTFFIGVFYVFIAQVSGTLLRFMDRIPGVELNTQMSKFETFYRLLPPVGELVFDVKSIFSGKFENQNTIFIWGVWLIIFTCLFRWKIRYPVYSRTSEH